MKVILTATCAAALLAGCANVNDTFPSWGQEAGARTLLCFDQGCVHVQGVTNIMLGIFIIGFSAYLAYSRRKLWPRKRKRNQPL